MSVTLAPELINDQELLQKVAYWRVANYLSVGQLFLLRNPLLRRPLAMSDIKHMLLGHWGTTPGQNFIYIYLNRVIKKYDLDMIYVAGFGHGGPAVVANTYLEGTYTEVYPDISQDEVGLQRLFKQFSFPGGIPSHASPECPGSIHEGGELGYSLSHSFGAVFDNPELIVACCVGDGEAETGPLATAWHSNKFQNPITDGAVLPILHLNGYKIANPTVLARIEPEELDHLLRGYGWTPYYVEGDDPEVMHQAMGETADLALPGKRRMGANPHSNGGILLQDLIMPDFRDYAVNVPASGSVMAADAHELGALLRDVTKLNQEHQNFRIFGPDETLSNRLGSVFEVTNRQWDAREFKNDEFLAASGRVLDSMLSEHQCQRCHRRQVSSTA